MLSSDITCFLLFLYQIPEILNQYRPVVFTIGRYRFEISGIWQKVYLVESGQTSILTKGQYAAGSPNSSLHCSSRVQLIPTGLMSLSGMNSLGLLFRHVRWLKQKRDNQHLFLQCILFLNRS